MLIKASINGNIFHTKLATIKYNKKNNPFQRAGETAPLVKSSLHRHEDLSWTTEPM